MLQKQALLNATPSADGSSLAKLCQLSLVGTQDIAEGKISAEASGTLSPLLQHQGPRARLLCNYSPAAGQQGGSV